MSNEKNKGPEKTYEPHFERYMLALERYRLDLQANTTKDACEERARVAEAISKERCEKERTLAVAEQQRTSRYKDAWEGVLYWSWCAAFVIGVCTIVINVRACDVEKTRNESATEQAKEKADAARSASYIARSALVQACLAAGDKGCATTRECLDLLNKKE